MKKKSLWSLFLYFPSPCRSAASVLQCLIVKKTLEGGTAMTRLGFDNAKYVKLQSQNIRDRISHFG